MIIALTAILPNKMDLAKWNFLRCISQSEIRNSAAAEKRGRAKIHSPQPPFFLPARALDFVPAARSAAIRSFFQKMFEQSCIIPPLSNFPIFARPIQPREARKGMETMAHRAERRGFVGGKSVDGALRRQPKSRSIF